MKVFRLGETYAELKAAALADRDLFDEATSSPGEGADTDTFDCHCWSTTGPRARPSIPLRPAIARGSTFM